jgi:hypothetical protein
MRSLFLDLFVFACRMKSRLHKVCIRKARVHKIRMMSRDATSYAFP